LTLLTGATPPTVRRLLERSPQDQKERLRDIGDARNKLADALANLASGAPPAVARPTFVSPARHSLSLSRRR
jgi:hypothetical protein